MGREREREREGDREIERRRVGDDTSLIIKALSIACTTHL